MIPFEKCVWFTVVRTGKQIIREKRNLSSRQGGARAARVGIESIVRIATCPGVCKVRQMVQLKLKIRVRKQLNLLIYIVR